MTRRFEELAWADTDIGTVTLRRRWEPVTQQQIYEVKLDEEFLMSSLFTVAEEEMARLALEMHPGEHVRVLVAGLGLGYTAISVLRHPQVETLVVIEALEPVIHWHERELLPQSPALVRDGRTQMVQADFFAMIRGTTDHQPPAQPFDVVLLDIDHSPRLVLDPSHAPFYTAAGLGRLAGWLAADGVLALWSDDPPDEDFGMALEQVFITSRPEVVTFPNPLTAGESANTVYLGQGLR
ncbi:MAG: spermidine synthase [Actinomycetota bacterium]|nr:spermidine synthase [Actinomycetota bacterium]